MQIHISPSDGVPIYLQIVNQVKYLVSSGRLGAGEELPPIRVLAESSSSIPTPWLARIASLKSRASS